MNAEEKATLYRKPDTELEFILYKEKFYPIYRLKSGLVTIFKDTYIGPCEDTQDLLAEVNLQIFVIEN